MVHRAQIAPPEKSSSNLPNGPQAGSSARFYILAVGLLIAAFMIWNMERIVRGGGWDVVMAAHPRWK